MTDDISKPDIIDIDPENIVEHMAASPAQPDPQPRPQTARIFGLGAVAMVLSGIAGGWIYRDFLSNYFPSDQVQTMAARVDSLEANSKAVGSKLDAVVGVTDEIKSQLGAAQAAAAQTNKLAAGLNADSAATKTSLASLQSNLSKASTAIDELRAKTSSGGPAIAAVPDSTGLASRVASLEKDVASLKQAGGLGKTDTALLSQSLADLKAKIAAGTPYQAELERIQRLVPAADGLDVLANSAMQGLPATQGLAVELKSIVAKLPQPEAPAAEDKSWWGAAANYLSSVITIKTVGSADWRGIASEVSMLTEQGNLAKAITVLENAEGVLPVDLQKWRDRAAARLALEAALERTSGAVLRQIAAKG